jgi:hypothetical protein
METTMRARRPLRAARPAAALALAEDGPTRAIATYVIATPLLWATGILMPAGALLLLWLAVRAGPRILLTPAALAWLLVGLAQGVSVVVNGVGGGETAGFIAHRLLSAATSGWFVLGLAVAVGAHFRMAQPPLVRAVCVLGGYFLFFGTFALLLHSFTGVRELSVPTPPALVLPATSYVVQSSFMMNIFTSEDLFGRELPRLILFYPWAPMLGFAGMAVFFISQLERSMAVRLIGSLGGLFAVLGSQSRAAAIVLLLLVPFHAFVQRSDRRLLPLAGMALLCVLALLVVFQISPVDIVADAYAGMTSLRPGSSAAREFGYALSIAGFLAAPVLGNGWPGPLVGPQKTMPIGSHSSVFGLLYTGGAVTFALFVIALVVTIVALVRRVRSGRPPRTGLVIVLSLAAISYGESIHSMILPCLPLLLFLGGTLADERGHIVSWRHA